MGDRQRAEATAQYTRLREYLERRRDGLGRHDALVAMSGMDLQTLYRLSVEREAADR